MRLTGSGEFSREEVENYFLRCLDAADRYDFLIISPQGKIIGESVINEIDWEIRKANFRIAVFNSKDCGKGIGSFAIRNTCKFVFEVLKLHRLELDVFSFNPRAIKTYQKAGFQIEGILRDAVMDHGTCADDILMAMLEDDWKKGQSTE